MRFLKWVPLGLLLSFLLALGMAAVGCGDDEHRHMRYDNGRQERWEGREWREGDRDRHDGEWREGERHEERGDGRRGEEGEHHDRD